jgi:serine/threonine kinase 16
MEDVCFRTRRLCESLVAYLCSIVGTAKSIVVNGEEFLVGKKIAEGAFSYVYLAKNKQTGQHYAMKRIITQTKEQRECVNWEIQVYRSFDHPHLLKLCGHVTEKRRGGTQSEVTSLVFPLCSRGSLESALQKRRSQGGSSYFTESEAIRYLHQICKGLKMFHDHSPAWAHMDIKPGNVLLDSSTSYCIRAHYISVTYTHTHTGGNPILMDFGSTSVARKTPKSRSEALRIQEWAAENCSMPYRAPELFEVKSEVELTERVDMWSLGCTLYALAFGYSPFECTFSEETGAVHVEKCSFLRVINGVVFPPRVSRDKFSSNFRKLIKDLTHKTASKRPSVNGLLLRTESWDMKIKEKSVV